ncbi:MAG: hypothetical protein ACI9GM_001188 [Salibacteraceae bacterium]|jgi:uncharacterized protein YqgV (UPF0045/DUF77 family)
MKVSIDISMYPLKPEYKPSIKAFIEGLKAYSEVTTEENNMSTQVFGEYRAVMKIVQDEIEKASGDEPKVVFVMKLIPFDLS